MTNNMLITRLQNLALASAVLCSAIHLAAATDNAPVCYGYLGCFPMSPPWHSPLRPVPRPQSPESVDTQFYLYTRSRPERFTVTKLPDISLQSSDYSGTKPTFFISHGFMGSSNSSWILPLKDALLNRVDSNVIVVNWQKGAADLNYLQVASNTRTVAAELARLMTALLASYNASPSRFHLIGHSMGAHIMSYAANRIPNIARITALDPAQPLFEGYPPEIRIDKSDAKFVEVIHSSARPFIPFLGLGMMSAAGHVDYYLNGGWDQPGCIIPPTPPNIASLYDLQTATLDEISYVLSCAHLRACFFYLATINNNKCVAWGHKVDPLAVVVSGMSGGNLAQFYKMRGCTRDSCSPVGLESINYPGRGSFFVATTGADPFCISEPISDVSMAKYRSFNGLPGM